MKSSFHEEFGNIFYFLLFRFLTKIGANVHKKPILYLSSGCAQLSGYGSVFIFLGLYDKFEPCSSLESYSRLCAPICNKLPYGPKNYFLVPYRYGTIWEGTIEKGA